MQRKSNKVFYYIHIPFVLFVILDCRKVFAQRTSSQDAQKQCFTPIVNSANEFGASLRKNIGEENNLFISPFSIFIALAMTYLGARGRTAQELEKAFHLNGNINEKAHFHESLQKLLSNVTSNNDEYSLFLANAIFVQRNFKVENQYIEDVKKFYHALVKLVDFANNGNAVKDEINKFVADNTHDKINDFLEKPLDPQTVVVLINAIYFKGIWKIQFPENSTTDGEFHRNDGSIKKVKYMNLANQKFRFFHDSEKEYKVLELPYKGDNISMIFVLPDSIKGSPNIDVDSEFLCKVKNQLKETKLALVHIPKFHLKYKKELTAVLNQLGIHDLFSSSANLSGISKEGDIKVSSVIHEAVIDVNEEGSEAAAVTGVLVTLTAATQPPVPIIFSADHPFIFYILDMRNGLVLFSGIVTDP